jgi:hypothetical protein
MVLSSFSCTSDTPYDRHHYEIVLKNHKKVSFDNWEDTQVYWWQHCQIPDFLDIVIVKDNKPSKGFGK